MSRFLTAKKVLYNSTASSSFHSVEVDTERMSRVMLFIKWTGGPVSGAAYAEAASDKDSVDFYRLDSLPVATITGVQGQLVIHLSDISCAKLRVNVVINSGSGDFEIISHVSGEA